MPIFIGGEGEIRTPEPGKGLPVFKTGAFNRSATSPVRALWRRILPSSPRRVITCTCRFARASLVLASGPSVTLTFEDLAAGQSTRARIIGPSPTARRTNKMRLHDGWVLGTEQLEALASKL